MKKYRKKIRRVKKDCYFCKSKTLPDYKNPSILRRSMTDRGKLLSSKLTGACSKHQRKLRKEVLRARFLALVAYVERPL